MATKDLVIMDENGQESIIPLDEVKKYIALNSTDAELWMFMGLAKAYNLNPFKREIHFVKYGTGENAKANIIIGYEVYLKRAMATGKLAWWNVEIDGSNASEMKAIFTAKRTDWEEPFKWEVYRSEFDKGLATWKSMPKFMLKKCAISQGLRLLFPEELGGMPYSPEEINGHTSESINNASVVDAEFEEDAGPEEKVEPDPEERQKALEKVLKTIASFKTVKDLDTWAGKQNIEKSILKDAILKALAYRRTELEAPTENGGEKQPEKEQAEKESEKALKKTASEMGARLGLDQEAVAVMCGAKDGKKATVAGTEAALALMNEWTTKTQGIAKAADVEFDEVVAYVEAMDWQWESASNFFEVSLLEPEEMKGLLEGEQGIKAYVKAIREQQAAREQQAQTEQAA